MKFSVYVVGSNPLPVIIALCYYCGLPEPGRESGEVHKALFIYSKETENYFNNIKTWIDKLKSPPKVEGYYLNNAHNPLEIYNAVKSKIEQTLPGIEDLSEVFINTSSGTKAMSINTVCALVDTVNEKNPFNIDLREADIDPENGIIYIIDPRNKTEIARFSYKGKTNNAFEDIITTEDIIRLYDYEKKPKKDPSFTLDTADKTIEFGEKIFESIKGYQAFQALIFSSRSLFEMKKTLKNHSIETNFLDVCKDILQTCNNDKLSQLVKFINKKKNATPYSFKPFFEFYKNTPSQIENIHQLFLEYDLIRSDENEFMSQEHFKFITGFWLEEYVWALLLSITQEDKRFEIINGLELFPKTSSKKIPFEIDLVFRNGYDITFISCTTDNTTGLVKSKAYEVLSNADCIGLRTKAILISLLNCNDELDFLAERNSSFSAQKYKKAKFLYLKDLKNSEQLKEQLKIYLNI